MFENVAMSEVCGFDSRSHYPGI